MQYLSVLIAQHGGTGSRVLIAKGESGVWELPHGRVRECESDEAAVARVCQETLGMEVKAEKLEMLGHKKPLDGTVEHIVCGNITHNTHTKCDYHKYYSAVNVWQTEPKTGVYTAFAWVKPSELGRYEFAGDDRAFMAKFNPWLKGEDIPNMRMD